MPRISWATLALLPIAAGAAPSLAWAASPSPSPPQTLTIEEAVARALRDNPRLGAARRRLEGRTETTTAAGRRMLPSVHLSEELQYYDRPFSVTFGSTALTVRDQTTNAFAASANQPVLGLLHLDSERESLAEGRVAAEAQLAAAEADLREAIKIEFLRTFEAQAMKHIAETSAAELSDQVTVARARLATGVITEADLLRLQVAVDNARQQALQA